MRGPHGGAVADFAEAGMPFVTSQKGCVQKLRVMSGSHLWTGSIRKRITVCSNVNFCTIWEPLRAATGEDNAG